MRKTYRSATKLTFPLRLNGERHFVKFEEQFYGYSTSEEKEQKAIEESPHFKRGEIKLFKSIAEEGDNISKKVVADPPVLIPTKEEESEQTENVDPIVHRMVDTTAKIEEQTSTTKVEGSTDTDGEDTDKVAEEGDKAEGFIDFPNITDINGAVEVLRGEPYNVHHMKVRTPAAIQEQAILNKVTFSNWAIE